MTAAPSPSPVLHVHKFLWDRGGLERYLFLLLDLLRERGHRVVTLGMRDERNRPAADAAYEVSPVRFPERPGPQNAIAAARGLARAMYSREAYRRTRQLIAETRPQVAHVHELHHHLSPSVLVALREAGVPVVLSAHEYKLVCPTVHLFDGERVCEACRGHRYWQPVLRRCSEGSRVRSLGAAAEAALHHRLGLYDERHVHVITGGSAFTLAKLREFGVDGGRLESLPYVLPPDQLREPPAGPGRYFLFVGRLVPYKGAATFVRALRLAGDPEAVIAGRGPQREELERLAADLGLRRLRFAGFVPDAELPGLVQGAIAAVVPSEVYETFGYAAYEAMAVGRPVVASRIGPLPELIRDGETGLLFDPGDSEGLAVRLSLLNGDRDRAHRMGCAARAFVEERNDVDRHYRRLLEIYHRASERSSSERGAVR